MTSNLSFLNVLCPLHAVIGLDGKITQAGPTLVKLFPSQDPVGQAFLDCFAITRPQGISDARQLRAFCGRPFHLRPRQGPSVGLKGVIVQYPVGDVGMILNLSFGISAVDAVQTFALSGADFAPTDLTLDMLYLIEAKSAVMAASRRLNERLLEARTQAEKQAVTDALTGVENRRGLQQFMSWLIARRAHFAILHVDLDHFKKVNDTLGHDAGDLVLQNATHIMLDELRDRDLVARVGGDEFILVIESGATLEDVQRIGQRLIDRFAGMAIFGEHSLSVGCSIGAVLSRQIDPPTLVDLLKAADIALYASKEAGRGLLTMYDPLDHGAVPAQQALDGGRPIAKPAV